MNSSDFHKEEYLTLRKEIESGMSELRQIEQYSILAAGAVYAWVATVEISLDFEQIAWFIPLIFSVFGAIRSASIGTHLNLIGSYIREIESTYLHGSDGPDGWENFAGKVDSRFRAKGTMIFWASFILVTLLIGYGGAFGI